MVKPSEREKFTATAYLKLLAYVHDLTYAIEADCWDAYTGPIENKKAELDQYVNLLDKFTTAMSRLPRKDVEEGMKELEVEDVMES